MSNSSESGLSSEGNSKLISEIDRMSLSSAQSLNRNPSTSYSRMLTFTRMLTFDAPAITRTFTQTVGFDEVWTQNLLDSYYNAAKLSPDGDIPIPAAFARNREFWKTFFLAAVNGVLIGFVALGFLNIADRVPRVWANNWSTAEDDDFFSCGGEESVSAQTVAEIYLTGGTGSSCNKYTNCDFHMGKSYWIGVTTVTGLLVGLIRYFTSYPDNLPGLFREILNYHVEPKWAPISVIISAISLGGGASLGPEQALSNSGGGLATWLKHSYIHFEDEDYGKLLVLAGMASAVGALFPTPLLGVLMIHELGEPPKSYMEATLIMSAGAIPAFLVYYALVDKSFIESFSSNGALLSANWEFNEWNCGTAVVIGMVCAPLGLLIFLIVGVTKQIFNRFRFRLYANNRRFLACVLPPVIAGVCIGTINQALPLTIGNGSMVISSIVSYGGQGQLSNSLLVCSILAKMFVLGLSMNCGFVGGFVFPILTIAIMAGVLCHQLNEEVPLGLALGCFLAALPSSVAPMPFTLSGLSIFVFYFGLYQTAPIFLSAIVSYSLVCGSGIFGTLLERGQKQTADLASKQQEIENERKEQKEQAVRFALGNYMNSKSKFQLGDKNDDATNEIESPIIT